MFGWNRIVQFFTQPVDRPSRPWERPTPNLGGYAMWAQLESLRGKQVKITNSNGAVIEGKLTGYDIENWRNRIQLWTDGVPGGIAIDTMAFSDIHVADGKLRITFQAEKTVMTLAAELD